MATPLVVDTSAWIEWLIGSDVGRELAGRWPARDDCIVPTIVQLELSKWALRETDETVLDQVVAYTLKRRVVALDTPIALLAAELHRTHSLATADAIVYATARRLDATLLTCDRHFDGLASVSYAAKSGSG